MDVRIDVIFDVTADSPYYSPTVDAVHHAAKALDVAADVRVIRTGTIDDTYLDEMPHAVLIGPGSPYDKPSAAETTVLVAREEGVPLVGT